MISFISSVGLRAGQLAAKPAPLGPGLPGFSFFRNTAYTVKDYEGFAFFSPSLARQAALKTGRFENGRAGPRPTLFISVSTSMTNWVFFI